MKRNRYKRRTRITKKGAAGVIVAAIIILTLVFIAGLQFGKREGRTEGLMKIKMRTLSANYYRQGCLKAEKTLEDHNISYEDRCLW